MKNIYKITVQAYTAYKVTETIGWWKKKEVTSLCCGGTLTYEYQITAKKIQEAITKSYYIFSSSLKEGVIHKNYEVISAEKIGRVHE